MQDRSIYEDAIFAKMLYEAGHMEKRDYDTYIDLFQSMSHFMQRPNIIVHLDVTPEESLRRIKLRNRSCESSVSIEYLTALHQGYEEFLNDISHVIPVIKVNYQDFPSVDEMVQKITEEYKQISNIRYVWYDQAPPSVREQAIQKALSVDDKVSQDDVTQTVAPVADEAIAAEETKQ